MKTLFSLLAMLIAAQFSYAQWTTSGTNMTTTNNVGIGISTTPSSPLEVGGQLTLSSGGVMVNSIIPNATVNGTARSLRFQNSSSTMTEGYEFYSSHTPARSLMFIQLSGKVGIGTTTPNGKLDVNGSIVLPGSSSNSMTRPSVDATRITGEVSGYNSGALAGDDGFLRISAGGGTNSTTKSFIDLSGYSTVPDMAENITLGTAGTERLRITGAGDVAIGTTDPQGHKLAVNGDIIATKVTVKPHSNWPDYVFKPHYNLPSLSAVKSYIDQHQHLPDMPSEAEVAKGGVDLGEMVRIQTQKIEELTLYLVEKDKKEQEQAEMNKKLEDKIQDLKNQFKTLRHK